MKRGLTIFAVVILLLGLTLTGIWIVRPDLVNNYRKNRTLKFGDRVDSLHGVIVYYNGGVGNTQGRTLTEDNYNIGKKYQCVEFVKRYYYERLGHKMPDSYGHAKDFFDPGLGDGDWSEKRSLYQYSNGSKVKPDTSDLVIFKGSVYNSYGHVAIVSAVFEKEVEIIQQNPGPFAASRIRIGITNRNGKWFYEYGSVLGWLRKKLN
ncbi:MAG: CHAP domain-containing protein [Bacteroidia bacterium]